jgi:hypothetical protein
MHPLNRFARKVEYSGWYYRTLGWMRRSIQPLYAWGLVLLLTSCTSLIAPTPFKLTEKEYIYLNPKDPNHHSLANSDPDTFRIKSKIDLSLKPDVIP